MALEFNSIGIKLKYCCETSAGTRPASGYTEIPDIKEIPEFLRTPSELDVTNLVDTDRRRIPGVKDSGGDKAFTANLTANLKSVWATAVSAAASAFASGKQTWWEVAIPNFDSFYFSGQPAPLGMSGVGVDAVLETQLHIMPNEIAGLAAKST
jgi:hypothetical protein